MKIKSKFIYGIVSALIFLLPFSVYLLIEALVHSVDYDYTVYGELADLTHLETDDGIFIYSTDKSVYYKGLVGFNDEIGEYGIEITSDDVVKIDKGYYQWDLENKELADVKIELIKKKQSYSVPIFVVFSAVGIVLAVLIISRKMQWHKKRPYEATIISLWVALGFLFGISFIVSNIFKSFLVITISFTGHYIWHLYSKGEIKKKEAVKKTSELQDTLTSILKEMKWDENKVCRWII